MLYYNTRWIVLNPKYLHCLYKLGYATPDSYINHGGTIVSGHPNRHVRRTYIDGLKICYLKCQHHISLTNLLIYYLFSSTSNIRNVHEGRFLQLLSRHVNCIPNWIAYGMNEKHQTFLLLETLNNTVSLVKLSDKLSASAIYDLSYNLGNLIHKLHKLGLVLSNICIKHVFLDHNNKFFMIDWESLVKRNTITQKQRVICLTSLYLSLHKLLCMRLNDSQLASAIINGYTGGSQSDMGILLFSKIIENKFDIYVGKQANSFCTIYRQAPSTKCNEFIWLNGERVCVTVESIQWWPTPPDMYPFYANSFGDTSWVLPTGEVAFLIRRQSRSMLGIWYTINRQSWNSPARLYARMLLRMQEHNIPVPRLLGFGQYQVTACTMIWFILYAPYTSHCIINDSNCYQMGKIMCKLHNIGYSITVDEKLSAFGSTNDQVMIRHIEKLYVMSRLMKELTITNCLNRIKNCLTNHLYQCFIEGYHSEYA